MVGEDPDRLLICEEEFFAVIKTNEEMIVKLEAKATESLTSRQASVTLTPVSTEVVKLQKISCPKFSGIPQDFAQFKEKFQQTCSRLWKSRCQGKDQYMSSIHFLPSLSS